jgi:hypothetical protein
MLISAGPAGPSRLGQAHFTSPVTLVRRRVYVRLRVLECLLFRLDLESLIIGVQTLLFIHIQHTKLRFRLC